jgi:hypothetical protein
MQKDNKEHDASQQRGFCTCAATAILDVSILPCDETWLVVFISEIKRAVLDSAATTWAAGMYTFFPPFYLFQAPGPSSTLDFLSLKASERTNSETKEFLIKGT